MTKPGGAPLAGITVLDLASVGPAARASRILSDYGASVIKIGPVPKDTARQIVPPHYAYSGGRGQERMLLDLKAPKGRQVFLEMASAADVVIESFRPGVVGRLGIDYAACRALNPGIIYCATSGYGQTGPKSSWAGHDINYLAAGGYLHCSTPRADGGPPLPGATVADIAAGGMQAVMAIMAALVGRSAHGEGAYLDVSIADGVLAMMSLYTDEYLATGNEPGPGHYILTGKFAWYDNYQTSDGKWMSVGAIEPQFFSNLCRELGCDQFLGHQYDDASIDDMRLAFTTAFATKTQAEWSAQLGSADCCVAPVVTVAEALADEQYVARGAIATANHPTAGEFRQSAPLYAGTTPPPVDGYQLPDGKATDTQSILQRLGFAEEEIENLLSEGVLA